MLKEHRRVPGDRVATTNKTQFKGAVLKHWEPCSVVGACNRNCILGGGLESHLGIFYASNNWQRRLKTQLCWDWQDLAGLTSTQQLQPYSSMMGWSLSFLSHPQDEKNQWNLAILTSPQLTPNTIGVCPQWTISLPLCGFNTNKMLALPNIDLITASLFEYKNTFFDLNVSVIQFISPLFFIGQAGLC